MRPLHFRFQGNRYCFRAEWVSGMTFCGIFLICCWLSVWQWQKAEAFAHQQSASQQIPQLNMTGTWEQAHFLLDNRTHKGRVGYYHLGLFRPLNMSPGIGKTLLVNLGWVPAPALRHQIPQPDLARGVQTITVEPMAMDLSRYRSNEHWPSPENAEWPKRIQSIDIERIALSSGQPTENGIWLLRAGTSLKTPVDRPSAYLSQHRHMGYALQWLLIGIAALTVFFFSAVRRIQREDSL